MSDDYDGSYTLETLKQKILAKLDFWIMVILLIATIIFFLWYNNNILVQCNSHYQSILDNKSIILIK